jgi:hypothetical protein
VSHLFLKQQLELGGTAECVTCGVALLLVSGPPVTLWCHGRTMSATRPVRCSERIASCDPAGPTAGTEYLDPATFGMLRCTRSGSGWPTSQAGALVPVSGDQWVEMARGLASHLAAAADECPQPSVSRGSARQVPASPDSRVGD